jgi:HlyD family secretion protein
MQKQDVLTVPFEALVDRGGQKAVFVVEKGIASERLVETEPGNELNDIVVSGLNKGDRVITNPSPSIHDGLEVNIVSPGERL